MSKKSSSVEWFWLNLNDDLIGDLPSEKILKIYELVQQAKIKHKEEIEDAYKNGWDAGDFGSDCWEEIYYNKTFGGEE